MLSPVKTINKQQLAQMPDNKPVKIIDVRPVDAYNGWTLEKETRGGHIKGARSLPEKWLKYIDWIEIVRHKNILPEDIVVIYGYNKESALNVAQRFIKSGYTKVFVYEDFMDEWVVNPDQPLERLANYKYLVSAEWVNDLISGEKPAEYNNTRFVIVHAHYRNRQAYLSGHIPGAIDMDTLSLEAPETWNRRESQELKAALEEHGISSDTTVILYGKFMFPDNKDEFPGSAAGDIGAMRCAFIMMYAGVKDVRVLNGGYQSWQDAGFETSTDDVKKQYIVFGSEIPAQPGLAVDTPEAKLILAAKDAELVCVRSWPEYIGEVSGYNYIEAKGRIPGALFADCGSDAYHMENYRNVDNTTREYQEIAESWINNGITPDKRLAFYCGTGWRGSEAWFNAWVMGWPNVSVYDGGWFEWSSDPNNPIETGVPESIIK
ncbi:MAG TPA: rhodanese-like domain-containing protein [Bacteroidales bacterium]|nr:rhodanese-like domain-containing protein [Bacteroidales bacterium]